MCNAHELLPIVHCKVYPDVVVTVTARLRTFIINFPYNTHFDWLKQRTLSENKVRVDDGRLAFEFLIRNFDKFDPN